MDNDLRTELAKAKGFGAAKSGATHWLAQRVTAVILTLFSVWLVFFIKCASKSMENLLIALHKPYNIVLLGIFTVASLYHAMLGMRVIIEDYIKCVKLRYFLIITLQIFCLVTIASFIVALFYAIIIAGERLSGVTLI